MPDPVPAAQPTGPLNVHVAGPRGAAVRCTTHHICDCKRIELERIEGDLGVAVRVAAERADEVQRLRARLDHFERNLRTMTLSKYRDNDDWLLISIRGLLKPDPTLVAGGDTPTKPQDQHPVGGDTPKGDGQ